MKFFARPVAGFVRNLAVATVIGTVAGCGGGDGVSLRPSSASTLSLLVSDGWIAAAFTDTNLRNPWGLAAQAGGRIWVANNLDHSATQYEGTGVIGAQVVNTGGAGDVTGIVANDSDTDFLVSDGLDDFPASLIFATGSGSLLAWAPDVDALNSMTMYTDAGGAQYTGLAIAGAAGEMQLYAADFSNGRIDIFDGAFARVDGTGKFVDDSLPEGYSPWNIQAVRRQGITVLAVAYAMRDALSGDADAGQGRGAVNLYDTDGALLTRLVRPGGRLNAPWGLAVAPASFGALGGGLLVGNTGDGIIRGFSVLDGGFLGTMDDANEDPIVVEGVRALAFGNGAYNQPAAVLFLTAGSNDGANGLYARVDAGTQVPDLIAPDSVLVTAPAAAATVSGTIDVTASANDNVGVVRVVFRVEAGGTISEIGTATAAPFGITWNSGTVADGPASLTAIAFDANGNSTTSGAVTITVDNPPGVAGPTVSISSPAAGDVSGIVTVTADAADDIGVAKVEFLAGAASLGTDTTAPYAVQWDTISLTGSQELTAVATDGEGNMTTSAVVSVNVVASTVTLGQLQATIFTPLCASCHNGGDDGLTNRMNLSSVGATLDSLVGINSEKDPGLPRVDPGNAAGSSLIRKLEGTSLSGERMPVGGPFLDQASIDLVRTWIQAGAEL